MEEDMTSPPSTMVPLRLLNPDLHVSGMSSRNRQLAVVSSSSTGTSRFRLPKGWTVKLVLRADGSRVDKYYYEPYTKQMFRSMREIERYLNGEEYIPRHKSPKLSYHSRSTTGNFGSEKMIVSEGRLLRLDENEFDQWQLAVVTPTTTRTISPFILPEGWLVEKVPRKGQGSDKYYYEPGTGRKFRSLIAVERYLQAERKENTPLSHMFEMGNNCGKDYVPLKRKKMGASASDFIEPPDKINWVLKDSGGLAWTPFIGRTFVPEPVKNQWAFRFMQLTSGKNGVAPDLKRWKRCIFEMIMSILLDDIHSASITFEPEEVPAFSLLISINKKVDGI